MKCILFIFIVVNSLLVAGLPGEYYDIKDTKQMKQYFFKFIKTIAVRQNRLILEDRKTVIKYYSQKDNAKLQKIQKRYKLKSADSLNKHLKHIDIVPISIVLSQAAVESGWGRSRFAKQANNIFGQWTWNGKGLVPRSRDANKKYKIKVFNSLEASVRGYLINLNIGHGYVDFRDKRETLRQNNDKLLGSVLVGTLVNYSQLREKYVDILYNIIKREKLERFD
ncbi:BAX protein [hydrothermal vent metagenome]|uniref:BAX protein n=1 Tax=hydrothermal vent metagenome TaxID=652676 RepID=A0A3B1E679_9ZZZZ